MLSTLVTGSGRAPQGRAPEEEEGWTGPSARWEEGLKRRGREAVCVLPIPPVSRGRVGVTRAGSLGVQVASVGARCGDSALVSQLPSRPPTAGLASRRAQGGGAGRATQSFQRQFQRVGRERLHGGARTRGTSD